MDKILGRAALKGWKYGAGQSILHQFLVTVTLRKVVTSDVLLSSSYVTVQT